ncbi:hypothetical protein L9F63_006284, partial [Diploptera punctata]
KESLRILMSQVNSEEGLYIFCKNFFLLHLGHGCDSQENCDCSSNLHTFPTGKFTAPSRYEVCECRRRKSSKKQIQSRETNLFDFVRLVFLRVIYGLATSMGFGEGISELFGGIFVPPGVDDDDYGDFDY